jgi:hypothetical protein
MVEFDCSKCWSLTTGSVEEEACSSSDRCARPRAAEELPGSVTVGQLADARTETGSSETITRLVLAAGRCRFRTPRHPNQWASEKKTTCKKLPR